MGVLAYFLVLCIFLEMSLVDLGQKVSNYLQNVNIRWGQMCAAIKMSNQVWSNAKKCQISGQMKKMSN